MPPETARSVSPVPRSLVPPPWVEPERVRAGVESRGYSLGEAPRSALQPAYAESPWWRTASGVCKVIAAAAAGLGVATGSLVAIIGALRQPTDPKLREDVESVKTEVASLRQYLTQRDSARALEQQKELDAIRSSIRDLDIRYPALKTDPLRSPK